MELIRWEVSFPPTTTMLLWMHTIIDFFQLYLFAAPNFREIVKNLIDPKIVRKNKALKIIYVYAAQNCKYYFVVYTNI